MLIGKELDAESGLYYFEARYMESKTGRFISTEPVGFVNQITSNTNINLIIPQSFNQYAYSVNNPYKYFDADGRWFALIHMKSIFYSLSNISMQDRSVLMLQQNAIDRRQSSNEQHMHAMATMFGDFPESKFSAWEKANEFVRNELTAARDLEEQGSHTEALKRLGNAMHTMQEPSSPSHENYQTWDGKSAGMYKLIHLLREGYSRGKNNLSLDAATQKAYGLFISKEPIPNEVLSRPTE